MQITGETDIYELSYLYLHYLQRHLIAFGTEQVNVDLRLKFEYINITMLWISVSSQEQIQTPIILYPLMFSYTSLL